MSATPDKPQPVAEQDQASLSLARRWYSDHAPTAWGRKHTRVLASCLLAIGLGIFAALVSLPAAKPDTRLVALYLAPPDLQCSGVDAPHPPLIRPLFGLPVSNSAVPVAAKPADANGKTAPPPKRLTDWRSSLKSCQRKEQLVLHVSSLARVDNGQVFLFGLDANDRTETAISLTDVIENLNRCHAVSKLLVLEVQWPLISDQGDSSGRLGELESAIKHQLQRFGGSDCHVLLASSGAAACRGRTAQPVSLLGHFLTLALQSGNADSDHNGRTTLGEVVRWAAPRIAAAANDPAAVGPTMPEQQIDWLAGTSSFSFAESPVALQPTQRVYPTWLAEAWQRRQAYLGDSRLPWDSDAAVRWGQLLVGIESGWRRGETEQNLQHRLAEQETAVTATIEQLLAGRRNTRADSLRLAALRVVAKPDRDDEQLAVALLAQHAEIQQHTPADKQPAQLAQAVTQYVAHYQADEAAVAMAALLRMFDNKALNDIDSLALVQQVNQACPRPLSYPVLDAVDRLIAMDAQPLRVQAVVQIFRLQEQLGTDPLATGILSDAIDNATQQLIFAQRLVWNPGLTDHAQVRRHVELAVNVASMTLIAEQSLGQAIRLIQQIDAAISTDLLTGAVWDDSEHLVAIEQYSEKLVQAIERMRDTAQHTGMLKSGELAMVRQACESLQREWMLLINLNESALQSLARLPRAPVTTALPVVQRLQLLARTQTDGSPLTTLRTVSSRSAAPINPVGQGMTMQRMRAHPLQTLLSKLAVDASNRYRLWCQNFLASASQIEAIPSYRRIAEMQLLAGNQDALPVVISGSLQGLDWNHPTRRIGLRYTVDLADAAPVQYKILSPAADSLVVTPSQGILRPGSECEIDIRLVRTDAAVEVDSALAGVWLCLRRGQQQQRIPLRMDPQPVAPNIDVDFGPQAIVDGCCVTLHLWPSEQPQMQSWNIRTRGCKLKAVVAKLSASDGTTLSSAPITLASDDTQPIRFLPAPPVAGTARPANGATGLGQTTDGGSAAALSALQGDLTLQLVDPALGTTVANWQIQTQLRDPRKMLELGWAEFDVADGGTNRLEVSLARVRDGSNPQCEQAYAPEVRLDLDPHSIPALLDYASSQLQTRLPVDGTPVTLSATNLRFQEGAEPWLSIPLRIDGDPGCVVLQGRFPRRRGAVQLDWLRTPTLTLQADAATTSALPLNVQVVARNLVDSQTLKLQLFSEATGWTEPVWQDQLHTSRHADVGFDAGGKDHTVQIRAERHDWKIEVPTEFGNGPHRLRVSTLQPVGVDRVVAEHAFVIDDSAPQAVAVRAVQSSQRTSVTVTMRPGPSGVDSVSLLPLAAGSDKPSAALDAVAADDSGGRWTVRWPQGMALPEQMQVTTTTGAGKSSTATCQVQIQTLQPVGLVVGTVREGNLAQPGLTVEVAKPRGPSFAQVHTDSSGKYQFALPPGKYVVRAKKTATGRSAESSVTVVELANVTADLQLTQ